jgi:hypothetical protein
MPEPTVQIWMLAPLDPHTQNHGSSLSVRTIRSTHEKLKKNSQNSLGVANYQSVAVQEVPRVGGVRVIGLVSGVCCLGVV